MIAKKKSFIWLIILTVLITGLTSSAAYCQSDNKDSSGIPTYAKVTFWGTFGLLLGKVFIYDTYFHSSENKDKTSPSDSAYNAIKYLLDHNQLSAYDSLTTRQEKNDFLNDFWNNLENSSAKNDLRMEFESRYAFADSTFRLSYKKGWKTDRGRIHILYGTPDERLIQPFQPSPFLNINSTKFVDLEIWYYNSPKGQQSIPVNLSSYNTGQMFFVFSRNSGNAEYEQIFSTELGEKIDAGLYGTLIPSKGTL